MTKTMIRWISVAFGAGSAVHLTVVNSTFLIFGCFHAQLMLWCVFLQALSEESYHTFSHDVFSRYDSRFISISSKLCFAQLLQSGFRLFCRHSSEIAVHTLRQQCTWLVHPGHADSQGICKYSLSFLQFHTHDCLFKFQVWLTAYWRANTRSMMCEGCWHGLSCATRLASTNYTFSSQLFISAQEFQLG